MSVAVYNSQPDSREKAIDGNDDVKLTIMVKTLFTKPIPPLVEGRCEIVRKATKSVEMDIKNVTNSNGHVGKYAHLSKTLRFLFLSIDYLARRRHPHHLLCHRECRRLFSCLTFLARHPNHHLT